MNSLYRIYDADDQLLYVGVSINLPARLTSHRHSKPWWSDAHRIDLEHYDSRAEVCAAEREAIRTEHPKHNIAHSAERDNLTAAEAREVEATLSRIGHYGRVLVGHGRPPTVAGRSLTVTEMSSAVTDRDRS